MALSEERKKAIGYRIAAARVQKGMSQDEVAVVLGYTSHAHVSRLESGERTPNLETLFTLSDLFGVKINYFFTDL